MENFIFYAVLQTKKISIEAQKVILKRWYNELAWYYDVANELSAVLRQVGAGGEAHKKIDGKNF